MIEDPIDFLQHEKNKNDFKSIDNKLMEYKKIVLSKNKFKFDAEFLFEESLKEVTGSIDELIDQTKIIDTDIEKTFKKSRTIKNVLKVRKITWVPEFINPIIEHRKSIII